MPRGNAAKRLAERFKPGIFDRLRQSKEAKKLHRNVQPEVKFVEYNPVHQDPTPIYTDAMPIYTGGMQHLNTFTNAGTVWTEWNTQITYQPVTSIVDPWPQWIRVTTRTNAITANTHTWHGWVTQEDLVGTGGQLRGQRLREEYQRDLQRHREAQAVEEAQWAARRREDEARWQAERQAIEVAKQTAKELLMSLLSAEQRDMLLKRQYFLVKAKSGRIYRIDEGTHGNLKVLDKDMKVIERLCIQPNNVPAGDAMLMQKLMIETAEDVFRSHANITLADGRTLMGDAAPLDGHKLAVVIPIRRAA